MSAIRANTNYFIQGVEELSANEFISQNISPTQRRSFVVSALNETDARREVLDYTIPNEFMFEICRPASADEMTNEFIKHL